MKITKNAHLRNAIGLPVADQNTLVPAHLQLRESHYQRALGLPSGRASLVSNIIEMWGNPYGN